MLEFVNGKEMFPRRTKKIFFGLFILILFILLFGYFHFHLGQIPIHKNVQQVYNYGVIVDAGSSGSRLFVYKWPPHSGKNSELLDISPLLDYNNEPIVKKVSPGLSSLADDPEKTSVYIKPLLDLAAESIPSKCHQETPLYIMATAGMRMIKNESRQAILANLRKFVKMNYKFLFSDNHAKVISGKEEGVYGWIATNYLLGRFNHNHTDRVPIVPVKVDTSLYRSNSVHHRKRTVGIIDMGGGSMQIAYELPSDYEDSSSRSTNLNLGCHKGDIDHTYKIFVTTFLGFGANAARTRYEREMLVNHFKKLFNDTESMKKAIITPNFTISDPCLHPGLQYSTKVKSLISIKADDDKLDHGGLHLTLQQIKNAPSVPVRFVGTGQFHICETRMSMLLDRESCHQSTKSKHLCVMEGRTHPPLDLQHSAFFGFSEFWYSTNDVLGLGGPYNYFKLHSKSIDYCKQNWFTISLLNKKKSLKRMDWPRKRYQCFKAAWLAAVLHQGLGFPKTYPQFTTVQEIKGAEVQWSLGALLYQTRYFPLRSIEQVLMQREKMRKTSQHRNYFAASSRTSFLKLILLILIAGLVIIVLFLVIHGDRKWKIFNLASNADSITSDATTNNNIRYSRSIVWMTLTRLTNFFYRILSRKSTVSLASNSPLLRARYTKVKSLPNFKDWD